MKNADKKIPVFAVSGAKNSGKTTLITQLLPILSAQGIRAAVVKHDGHDFDALEAAFAQARAVKGRPFAIVMKTTKGKGVSYMENQVGWHGKAPNDEQAETALKELGAELARLEAV